MYIVESVLGTTLITPIWGLGTRLMIHAQLVVLNWLRTPHSADCQLKVFIAQETSNGEQFLTPLRDIQKVLERSEVKLVT